MSCVELQRLKQQYQTGLRIWGQFEFPLRNEPVGSPARQTPSSLPDAAHENIKSSEAMTASLGWVSGIYLEHA